MSLVRVANHAEKGLFLFLTVDRPLGIKDLVTAVLRVGLSKHHQFDIGRIALSLRESIGQVVDFVFAHGQTHREVGISQSLATFL